MLHQKQEKFFYLVTILFKSKRWTTPGQFQQYFLSKSTDRWTELSGTLWLQRASRLLRNISRNWTNLSVQDVYPLRSVVFKAFTLFCIILIHSTHTSTTLCVIHIVPQPLGNFLLHFSTQFSRDFSLKTVCPPTELNKWAQTCHFTSNEMRILSTFPLRNLKES